MVRIVLILFFLFCQNANASNIKAHLEKDYFLPYEQINLFIEISGAKKTELDLRNLEEKYKIISRRKSHMQKIINGRLSVSETIILGLEGLKAGQYIIPEISLKNKKDKTQPISLIVTEKIKNQINKSPFSASFRLSSDNIYKSESFILSIVIAKRTNHISSEKIIPPQSNDFIIENIGEIENYSKIIQNQKIYYSQVNFLLTPISAGKLNIDLGRYEASVIDYQDNIVDPFANFMNFSLNSNNINYSVPIKDSNLEIIVKDNKNISNLNILEELSLTSKTKSDYGTIGKPIEYSINIKALNIKAEQLNEIELTSENFKIYPEAALTENNFNADELSLEANKTRNFILIPLKTGSLKLPEFSYKWYDKNKNEIIKSQLDIKFVEIKADPNYKINDNAEKTDIIKTTNSSPQKTEYLYILFLIIIILFIYNIIITYKFLSLTKEVKLAKVTKPKNKNTELNKDKNITNYQDLNLAIKEYMQKHYQVRINNIGILIKFLRNEKSDHYHNMIKFLEEIEEAEFSGHSKENNFKKLYQQFLAHVKIVKMAEKKDNNLCLNP